MPVMDDIREEASKAKGKGFKYAVSYFWGYYKFWLLGIIVVGAILFSLIKTIVTTKPTAFEAILIDAYMAPDDAVVAGYLGIDTDKQSVYQDVSYQFSMENGAYTQLAYTTSQKLAAAVAAKEVDVIVCSPEVFSRYKNHILGDLSTFFSQDFLDELGDRVIYDTVVDSDTNEESGPYPLAIEVTNAPVFISSGSYREGEVLYYCIVPNTQHPEYCVKYYEYLYSEE